MRKLLASFLLFFSFSAAAVTTSEAAWVWSPDLGKWINPKKTAKDTPEEQYSWAMEYYNQGDWDRAREEFEKLPQVFPTSRLAAEGVYYAAMCWEQKGDLAKAADGYQKLIDKYPYSDRIKDAIKKEFDIAGEFASGAKMKVLGMPVLSGQEKAIELYKHIVKNAPYGSYGDHAQYQLGEVYKMQGSFDEAKKAYQAIVDDYPNSVLVGQARYQIAYSSMRASNSGQYDEANANRAIEEFEGFKKAYPTNQQAVEADESIKAIRAEKAKISFENAKFYDKQKKFASAKVYYQEVASQYPETAYAERAKRRLDEILTSESGEPQGKPRGFRLW